MRERTFSTPALTPRLLLAASTTTAALVAPLGVAAAVAIAAAWIVMRRGSGPMVRLSGWMVLGLTVATVLLQMVLVGVVLGRGLGSGAALGAAFSVRSGAVLLVASATSAVLPPRAWLASLSRFPRLALVLMLIFRQVPDVAAEATRVRAAQRARGLLVGRTVPALATVAPVMTRTLERADRTGRVLFLAGWGARRTDPLVRPRWSAWDFVWILMAALVVVLIAARPWG